MRKLIVRAGLAAGTLALVFGIGAPAGAQSVCVTVAAEIQGQQVSVPICIPPSGAPEVPGLPTPPELPGVPPGLPGLPPPPGLPGLPLP